MRSKEEKETEEKGGKRETEEEALLKAPSTDDKTAVDPENVCRASEKALAVGRRWCWKTCAHRRTAQSLSTAASLLFEGTIFAQYSFTSIL